MIKKAAELRIADHVTYAGHACAVEWVNRTPFVTLGLEDLTTGHHVIHVCSPLQVFNTE